MAEDTRKGGALHDGGATLLGELIHAAVRHAIEVAVHEELEAALGADAYERTRQRRGYRNGIKPRTLTGRPGRWPWPCRGPRCSRRAGHASGPRPCSRATSAGCGR